MHSTTQFKIRCPCPNCDNAVVGLNTAANHLYEHKLNIRVRCPCDACVNTNKTLALFTVRNHIAKNNATQAQRNQVDELLQSDVDSIFLDHEADHDESNQLEEDAAAMPIPDNDEFDSQEPIHTTALMEYTQSVVSLSKRLIESQSQGRMNAQGMLYVYVFGHASNSTVFPRRDLCIASIPPNGATI